MRLKTHKQLPLKYSAVNHKKHDEYLEIGKILSENPMLIDMVHEDLSRHIKNKKCGARGMTSDQVLRALIIKTIEGYSYEKLAFHLNDSGTFRYFCNIGFADKPFKKSAISDNIKKITPDTLAMINTSLMLDAKEHKTETGKEVRIDCTVVESNIHEPTDSRLLEDCIRVMTRILIQMNRVLCDYKEISFKNHNRVSRRRILEILNAKNKSISTKAYRDLIRYTKKTIGYSQRAIKTISKTTVPDFIIQAKLESCSEELCTYIKMAEKVINQTERRVFNNEKVPASEKIVSIFEPHTDIIIKDRRDVSYGHKICVTGGKSNLITDCIILDGNPADSTLVETVLDRHNEIYDRYPLKAALDGGFASKNNVLKAKKHGVKDVCFAKRRGIKVEDMCRSKYVYKRLRKFRAGIESGISWLKRSLGLTRCTWKSKKSFKSYVWSSIISGNLLTLARIRLKAKA